MVGSQEFDQRRCKLTAYELSWRNFVLVISADQYEYDYTAMLTSKKVSQLISLRKPGKQYLDVRFRTKIKIFLRKKRIKKLTI